MVHVQNPSEYTLVGFTRKLDFKVGISQRLFARSNRQLRNCRQFLTQIVATLEQYEEKYPVADLIICNSTVLTEMLRDTEDELNICQRRLRQFSDKQKEIMRFFAQYGRRHYTPHQFALKHLRLQAARQPSDPMKSILTKLRTIHGTFRRMVSHPKPYGERRGQIELALDDPKNGHFEFEDTRSDAKFIALDYEDFDHTASAIPTLPLY